MGSYKQILADNVEMLAKQKGIGKTEACIESGAGRSFISNMINKDQTPSFDKVMSLAEYFGVSIDYLVGYNPTSKSNPKTDKLISLAAKLSEDKVDLLIDMCSKFLDK